MNFNKQSAQIYFPNENEKDLSKTTHICFSAHQDDIEIMAYSQICECYYDENKYFTAVNISDGAGSPRTGEYANFTNEEMVLERIKEQKKAGDIGKYHSVIMLMYPSKEIKDGKNRKIIEDIKKILLETKPTYVYTHNLMDKHLTHIGSAIKVIEALRELKDVYKPKQVIGLEVWRGLDWLTLDDKLYFDTSKNEKLALDLINVFKSQVVGGKRYDLATMGRRSANATFFESHFTDEVNGLSYGVDLTNFVYSNKTYTDFAEEKINNFKNEVISQIKSVE